ncbi:hypothetical protein H5407_21165 [Mitsuaria sp. WAJ17]|uniref:hypothetical protein n=1 Tax=Mitsuaria sp. WAJ17 TaxID=2761452 RepID=UPI001601E72D|nr:hypothetical protein [Mitsuaria sp. WAJ17]MBB2487755.1 hypothetical protein [Mitsuaria sp. WAJ17]
MSLTLESASFDKVELGVSGARTDDGRALSILFTGLEAASQPDDQDATPQAVRADGRVRCRGTGWVSVQVRGGSQIGGPRGLAHVMVWANGRRIALMPDSPEEPLAGATTARIGADGELRLSLTLLAQRDLAEASSGAMCWVDSIDVQVLEPIPRSAPQQRVTPR